MKSKILLGTLFASLLMSCESDLKTIGVYDGKQTLDFCFSVEASKVLDAMERPQAIKPTTYKVYLFDNNLYTQTLTLDGNGSIDAPEGSYSYFCIAAETTDKLPQLTLKEGETKMTDVFLKLTDDTKAIVRDVPSIVVSTGSFTMGSTINTVPVALKPLGCKYTFTFKYPADIQANASIAKVKAIIEGGAATYNYNLQPLGEATVETVMKGAGIDNEGWIPADGDATTFSADVLLTATPALQLKLIAKDENGNETEIGKTKIDLSANGASYAADIVCSKSAENIELQYHSPYFPTVVAHETNVLNEHKLEVTSTVYPGYTYQWRHERTGRTILLGLSNNKLKYKENGIDEGASAIVTGAGNYILSIGKDGISKDVATLAVKHATMTWHEAKAKVEELGSDKWTLPNREQMQDLYNNGMNDFYYDEITEKPSAISYWTSDESGANWAYVYFFDPYWEAAPTWTPEKTTIHSARLVKLLPFEHDPTDPFSVGMMLAPTPYVGEQELTITTPTYAGATYQWKHKTIGRKVLRLSQEGSVSYIENGIPEGATVKVTGAGTYTLSVTYAGETREIGSVILSHKNLCWSDVETELAKLNNKGNHETWIMPTIAQLRAAYNNGVNDFAGGWYWAQEFTNSAQRWKYLKDMASGVEDGGDITDKNKKYNIRFYKAF